MGGKSTLLTTLLWVGSFVPAESARMRLVELYFIDINDSIIDGKSTFFKEMEETKANLTKLNYD